MCSWTAKVIRNFGSDAALKFHIQFQLQSGRVYLVIHFRASILTDVKIGQV
jgi:hypothetical protein